MSFHIVRTLQFNSSSSIAIATTLGFNYVPWFKLTKFVIFVYAVLTCCVLFFRPDFINLTVCTAATFMILNTDLVKKWTFRVLVRILVANFSGSGNFLVAAC